MARPEKLEARYDDRSFGVIYLCIRYIRCGFTFNEERVSNEVLLRYCVVRFLINSNNNHGTYAIIQNTLPSINSQRVESLILNHWGRVTDTCLSYLTIIGSDNDLLPGRCQAIIYTSAQILSNWTVKTNFSETLSEIHTFSFKNMHFKMSSAKWWQFCLGLSVFRMAS